MEKVTLTKQDMIDLLGDWTNCLYAHNPPKSIYDDISFTIPDFVEGYFSVEEDE